MYCIIEDKFFCFCACKEHILWFTRFVGFFLFGKLQLFPGSLLKREDAYAEAEGC